MKEIQSSYLQKLESDRDRHESILVLISIGDIDRLTGLYGLARDLHFKTCIKCMNADV